MEEQKLSWILLIGEQTLSSLFLSPFLFILLFLVKLSANVDALILKFLKDSNIIWPAYFEFFFC